MFAGSDTHLTHDGRIILRIYRARGFSAVRRAYKRTEDAVHAFLFRCSGAYALASAMALTRERGVRFHVHISRRRSAVPVEGTLVYQCRAVRIYMSAPEEGVTIQSLRDALASTRASVPTECVLTADDVRTLSEPGSDATLLDWHAWLADEAVA